MDGRQVDGRGTGGGGRRVRGWGGGGGGRGGGARAVAVGVLVLGSDPGWRALRPGSPVSASGRLAAPRGGDLTAAVLSTAEPPDSVGVAPWPQRAAGALRAGLRRACAPLPRE